ncbi:helix-turn-helix transcriptional regulator [Tannerella forsythia]|uniref:helix-turn-helix domain-containing protein n=1 Tax=Tannerella forsythia TaxID=28112 RepID=UPI0028E200B2|nr:helix-turn-helix transcriptional regulator [Tannerella forsythia]
MSTINERIKIIVDKFANGKNTELARLLSTSEANIRNYTGNVMPKFDFLSKIATSFDISPEWLLTGKGNMLREQTEQTESSSTQIDITPSQMLEEIKALSVKIGHLEAENKILREQVKNKRQYNPYPSVAESELKYR